MDAGTFHVAAVTGSRRVVHPQQDGSPSPGANFCTTKPRIAVANVPELRPTLIRQS